MTFKWSIIEPNYFESLVTHLLTHSIWLNSEFANKMIISKVHFATSLYFFLPLSPSLWWDTELSNSRIDNPYEFQGEGSWNVSGNGSLARWLVTRPLCASVGTQIDFRAWSSYVVIIKAPLKVLRSTFGYSLNFGYNL